MGSFHTGQSFRSRLFLCEILSIGHSSSRKLTPVSAFHRERVCSFLQGMSTCSSVGASMGCSMDMCFTVDLHGLLLQGNLCSSVQNICFPSFFSAGQMFSHSSFPAAAQQFLPFLKYVLRKAFLAFLMDSALASGRSSHLSGTGCVQHVGSSWRLLTEVTPAATSLPISCHKHPRTESLLSNNLIRD